MESCYNKLKHMNNCSYEKRKDVHLEFSRKGKHKKIPGVH